MTAALHSLAAHAALGCAVITILAAFFLPKPMRLDGLRILTAVQFTLFTLAVWVLSPLWLLPVADVALVQVESAGIELHKYSAMVLWAFSSIFAYVALRTNAGERHLQWLAAAQMLLMGLTGALGGSLVHG